MKILILFVLLFFVSGCCQLYYSSNPIPLFNPEKIEKLRECFNIAARIPYKYETCGDDYWQTPDETINRNTGDCEDKAIYLQYLLRKEGMESEVCFGKTRISDSWYHSWVEYRYIDNIDDTDNTFVIDPTNMVFVNRKYIKTGLYNKADYLPYAIDRICKYQLVNDTVINLHYTKIIEDALNK